MCMARSAERRARNRAPAGRPGRGMAETAVADIQNGLLDLGRTRRSVAPGVEARSAHLHTLVSLVHFFQRLPGGTGNVHRCARGTRPCPRSPAVARMTLSRGQRPPAAKTARHRLGGTGAGAGQRIVAAFDRGAIKGHGLSVRSAPARPAGGTGPTGWETGLRTGGRWRGCAPRPDRRRRSSRARFRREAASPTLSAPR